MRRTWLALASFSLLLGCDAGMEDAGAGAARADETKSDCTDGIYAEADYTEGFEGLDFNLFAFTDDAHADGVDMFLPAKADIEGVDIATESFFEPSICSVLSVSKRVAPSGKKAVVVRVKALELGLDDGSCTVDVRLRDGKHAVARMELVGT